jgi:hypothetical protein
MAQAFRDGASSSAKSSAGASSERREAFAAPSLRNLRTIISAEPSHWTWQRSNDAAPLAMNAALQDWLSQLDAAAGNGWQPTASLPSATKQTLQLMRDGRVAHTFGLSDTGITWQTGDGVRKSSAPGADLQPALERIAP